MLRCSLNLLLSTPPTPPTIVNSNGIPTAAQHHSGTPTTPLVGAVASAVCKSHATLRLTTLRLNAAASPTPARARIPATLRPASPFQRLLRLLQFLVCRRLARGIPTIQPVGRLVSVSIPHPCHLTAVGLCTQRSLNVATLLMLDRRTTSVSQTWMGCPPVSMALSGTPSMILPIRVLPSCLFLHLDLVNTLPVRRSVVNPLLHHGTTRSRFKHVLMDLSLLASLCSILHPGLQVNLLTSLRSIPRVCHRQ